MATPVIETLIELDDRGRAWIAGSRMLVSQLIWWKRGFGWSAEELIEEFPWSTPAQIHAALAYYYSHESEIEAELATDEALYLQHKNDSADLRERLLERRNPSDRNLR